MIEEIEKDLGRKLTEEEKSLLKIAYLKGYSKGYEAAMDYAIKTINK